MADLSDISQAQRGQDVIWDYYQNESPETFEGSRARVRLLLSRIPPSRVILNVGCGSGLFEEMALAKKVEVYSLDPSERSIRKLRQTLGLGDRAQAGYIEKIPFADSSFDVVVVSEVIEHLTPEVTRAGLREILRVLKPGGSILGTVPSREDLRGQIAVCPDCGKRFHKWGHQQSFDPGNMRRLLGEYFGSVRVVERPIIPWNLLNWKGKCFETAKALLWRMGIHGSNENLVFDARKPEDAHPGR